jgi:hypothetical protein
LQKRQSLYAVFDFLLAFEKLCWGDESNVSANAFLTMILILSTLYKINR